MNLDKLFEEFKSECTKQEEETRLYLKAKEDCPSNHSSHNDEDGCIMCDCEVVEGYDYYGDTRQYINKYGKTKIDSDPVDIW